MCNRPNYKMLYFIALLSKLTTSKKWCVLTRESLYCFEKHSSKQQITTIAVRGMLSDHYTISVLILIFTI